MKRLLACLALVTLFVLSFPALFAQESRNITGISSVAQAGRMTPSGRWCQCGESGCICDPGEEPCTACPGQGLTVQSNNDETALVEVDTGSMLTFAVAAVLLVLRLRHNATSNIGSNPPPRPVSLCLQSGGVHFSPPLLPQKRFRGIPLDWQHQQMQFPSSWTSQ